MNILLDYMFKITSIDPTPAASTAFLKQVCVVGKPKDGGVTTKVIASITDPDDASDYFGAAASAEVAKLFSGGLAKVFILPMDDLGSDLADALEGHESDFFTILVSSDFVDADVEHSDAVHWAFASKQIQDILYTAKAAGLAGNSIDIDYNIGAGAGLATVVTTGNHVVFTISSTTTAATIKAAAEADSPTNALVGLAVDSGDETDIQSVISVTALEGGLDEVIGTADGMDVGAFEGVVGVSSTDDDFLSSQAGQAGRSAWHTTSSNKAKNMFYAFGKLLSNATNWRNQQYIPMPLADDVDTLGEAQGYFDDKINFVISDDEFGTRLGLFVAGGKAIVAPYIKRNLQIDLQSAALTYISGNEPGYTKVQAALLEDELQKVIKRYVEPPRAWIEQGTIAIDLLEDNFVASGNINIAEPKALWRIDAEMQATL